MSDREDTGGAAGTSDATGARRAMADPASGARRSAGRLRSLRDDAPEVLVEGYTMALYISLSLLAVVVAMPDAPGDEPPAEFARLILLTVAGLVLAHLVAFRLSARMVHGGRLPENSPEIIGAQAVGGLAVAVIAVVPVLVFGLALGGKVAEVLLLGIVALAGYSVAAQAGVSRTRRIAYVGGVILLTSIVLAVKAAAGH